MDQNNDGPLRSKICKSCEQCTKRKVRCIMPPGESPKCTNCIKRGDSCLFRETKRKLRISGQRRSSSPRSVNASSLSMNSPSSLFLDQMLDNHPVTGLHQDDVSMFKTHGHRVASSNLAYFSEHRIASLSQKLGNNRLRELLETIESAIQSRVQVGISSPFSFKKISPIEQIQPAIAKSYIDAYFIQLHGAYPFLDRIEFEAKAFSPNLPQILASHPPFSALYHAILALGCQYCEGSTFDPGKGTSWKLYEVSLGLIGDIIAPKETLINLQALVAMSIYALNMSCLQIDEVLIKEAARMAQSLDYHKVLNKGENKVSCYRTFWVIYAIEKQACLHGGSCSIIADYDIGCPIPETPDAVFGEYNWLLSSVRLGRIFSVSYISLFSASAATKPIDSYYAAIDHIQDKLDRWKMTVPEEFRPGCLRQHFSSPCAKLVALQTHFCYYSIVIALARFTLHIDGNGQTGRCDESKRSLMNAARSILELTRYIDTDAHTPLFILAIMPIVALFILFDFVVHNPTHPETRNNLSFLDVAAGHFSLLEYKSGGSVPASNISEFAAVARQYIRDFQGIPENHEISQVEPLESYEEWNQWQEDPHSLNYPLEVFNGNDDAWMFDFRTLFGPIFPDFGSTLETIPESMPDSLG